MSNRQRNDNIVKEICGHVKLYFEHDQETLKKYTDLLDDDGILDVLIEGCRYGYAEPVELIIEKRFTNRTLPLKFVNIWDTLFPYICMGPIFIQRAYKINEDKAILKRRISMVRKYYKNCIDQQTMQYGLYYACTSRDYKIALVIMKLHKHIHVQKSEILPHLMNFHINGYTCAPCRHNPYSVHKNWHDRIMRSRKKRRLRLYNILYEMSCCKDICAFTLKFVGACDND